MIGFKVRNLEELKAMLATLPYGVIGVAVEAFTDYLIGNASHGLKHYPAYKYVSRKSAYGVTFFSDKQRRWFFANLKEGNLNLPYTRTNKIADNWEKGGDRWRRVIRNDTPYIGYVMGDTTQSRMSKKIGWRTTSRVIKDNMMGALRAASQAVARYIKSKEIK